MRVIAFHQQALAQFSEWAARDKKTFDRLTRLISETARTPFEGIGKPETLKRELNSWVVGVRLAICAIVTSLLSQSEKKRARSTDSGSSTEEPARPLRLMHCSRGFPYLQ